MPAAPETDDPDDWETYAAQVAEVIAAGNDYSDVDMGPQLLAVKSNARGTVEHLARLIGPQGAVTDASGGRVVVRHGFRDGLTPTEMFARTRAAREGLDRTAAECAQIGYG